MRARRSATSSTSFSTTRGDGFADSDSPIAGDPAASGRSASAASIGSIPGQFVELLGAPLAGRQMRLEGGRFGVVENAEGVGTDGLVFVRHR
ncbi:hypothetical protein STENM223S_02920 [Streptomyces tendae]